MATIDVFIPLGPNSKPIAQFCNKFMRHLQSNKHEIRYKGILGGVSGFKVEGVDIIASVEAQPGPGDMTHTAVLEEAMNHIEADYTLISDSDVAVLCQDWDDICVREITGNIAAIGFKIPDVRCKTFPCVRFCMFDSAKLVECKPNFRPVLSKGPRQRPVHGIPNENDSKYLGTARMYMDTGWKMPVAFFEKGYRGLVMPYLLLKKSKIPPLNEEQRKRMGGKILGHEEYYWNDKLFAVHKGQVKRGFNPSGLWESRIIAYAKEHFGLALV